MNLHEKDVAQTTAEWISQLQKDLEDSSREFAAAMAEYEKEQDEAFKILALHGGWLGMERHFTSSQARLVVQLYRTEGAAAMNDAIANYFNIKHCARLSEMTNAWSSTPYLRDRQAIIRDAVSAHREGHFTLTVPALLPLVEGLSAEIVGIAIRNQNVVKAVARDWKRREAEVWAQVFADVVEHVIYKSYDFGNDRAPYLNRHGILHGRVPDYADKLNSLRVFLLVDAIAHLWHEKQQKTPLSTSTIASATL